MSVAIPHEVRYVTPFLVRAKELETIQPAVSYWTKYWAVQKILSKNLRAPEIDALLLHLVEELEEFKRKNSELKEIANQETAARTLSTFALQVFDNADREERARRATTSTVEKFMAAAVFLEACESFGSLSKDILDKRKYSKVQAMRIGSAIAAGKDPNTRKMPTQEPVVSPLSEQSAHDRSLGQAETEAVDSNSPIILDKNALLETQPGNLRPYYGTPSGATEINRTEGPTDPKVVSEASSPNDSILSAVKIDSAESDVNAPSVLANDEAEAESEAQDPDHNRNPTNTRSTGIDTEQAQKHAKWAISALNYEDIDTAVTELKKALKALAA